MGWSVMFVSVFQVKDWFEDGFSFSSLGERGWGLSEMELRIIRFGNDKVVRDLSPTLRSGDASRSAVVEKIKEQVSL